MCSFSPAAPQAPLLGDLLETRHGATSLTLLFQGRVIHRPSTCCSLLLLNSVSYSNFTVMCIILEFAIYLLYILLNLGCTCHRLIFRNEVICGLDFFKFVNF